MPGRRDLANQRLLGRTGTTIISRRLMYITLMESTLMDGHPRHRQAQSPPGAGLARPDVALVRIAEAGGGAPCGLGGRAGRGHLLESANGREYAQWYVYKSPWFMALLGLLALNILAATMVRFPWRRGHRGFLLTHAGVLVLLAGAMLTFVAGVEGQLGLEEGQSGDTLVMTDRSQLTRRLGTDTRTGSPRRSSSSPDRPTGRKARPCDLGSVGGVQLEVLKFYRHARSEEQWVEDPSAAGSPAVQLALTSADGTPMVQQWLAADPFADEVFFGPVRLAFQRASAASMLEDFVNPPSEDKERRPTASSRCTTKAGCTGFRCGKTWGRRWPWARATSAWKSPPICPTPGPTPPPISPPPASSRTTRCWS